MKVIDRSASESSKRETEGMFDIHNHMLPGLDDGAHDWDMSLEMAQMAVEDGISGVVCTPHWVSGIFNNRRTHVLRAVEILREKLEEHKIPLLVYPGSELRLDFEIPEKVASSELLTINDTGRYAMIEFPDEVVPQNIEHFFWELQCRNVTPIIVHPERNRVFHRDPMRLYRLVEQGTLTQITGASLVGRFGSDIRKFTITLLEHKLAHVLATDAHGSSSRSPRLAEAARQAEEIIGKSMVDQLTRETPKSIIDGEEVALYDLIPFGNRPSLWKKMFFMFGKKAG